MNDLLIHADTRREIERVMHRPSHAVLLTGDKGVGLQTIARYIAASNGVQAISELIIPDEKNTIGIDVIRKLYGATRTKQAAMHSIIIDDADTMGIEAQNALLKLLEEPSNQTSFIMTSHYPQVLLPTIMSRLQRITVRVLAADATDALLDDQPEAQKKQLRFIAGGLPAEMYRLKHDTAYLARTLEHMSDAKRFIACDSYDRLLLASRYAATRDSAEAFLVALSRLILFMVFDRQQADMTIKAEIVQDTFERIKQNAHVKTQLAYLATRF